MDEQSFDRIINTNVIPKLDEFLESESAFFVYVGYQDSKQGTYINISPAPPVEIIEDVARKIGGRIYKETNELPYVVVACRKVKYGSEISDIDLMDSGIIIVAMEASKAEGFMYVYSLPDMNKIMSKSFDKDSDDVHPYVTLAIAALIHESLSEAGLSKKEGNVDNIGSGNVIFRFSRN